MLRLRTQPEKAAPTVAQHKSIGRLTSVDEGLFVTPDCDPVNGSESLKSARPLLLPKTLLRLWVRAFVLPNGYALNLCRVENITPIELIHVNKTRTITFVLRTPSPASLTNKRYSGRLALVASNFCVEGCKLRSYAQ